MYSSATSKKKYSKSKNSVTWSHLDDVLQLIKGKFKSEFVDPLKFKKDLSRCYISKFFVGELRNFYTDKERISFLKKQNPNKTIKGCTTDTSNMCHQALYDYSILAERQKYYVFKSKGILSNLKFYHFHKNDLRNNKVKDKSRFIHLAREPTDPTKKKFSPTHGRITEGTPPHLEATRETISKVVEEVDQEELLIERQDHHCALKQSPAEKAKQSEMVREEHLRDYRLIHSGLIEVALSNLLPSRPREEASKNIIDFSPLNGKYADMDDMDLDYLFDADEPQDEGLTGDPTQTNTLKTTRPSNLDEANDGKYSVGPNKKDLQFVDHIYPHGSSEESVSSEEETEKETTDNKLVRKPASPIKRKDSGGGLFGIAEWDSDEEDLPKQKAFSFVDTNLDKFNVLNFIEKQEHKVANN